MPSILHVTVLAEREKCPILLAAVSSSISRQVSFAAGRIHSYPIVKGFSALAIWSATTYDALNEAMLTDVDAFSTVVAVAQLAAVFAKNVQWVCLLK